MRTLAGVGSTPRTGVGTARWYRPEADLSLPDRPDPDAVDAEAELDRYEAARDAVRRDLRGARDRTAERVGEEEAAVFEAHEGFLDDPTIVEDVEAAIRGGTPAEHAVADRFDEAVAQFEGMEGRMAERADDLRDVRDRLLRALLAGDAEASAATDLAALPDGTVLLAERLTPSDTAALDPDAVAGIATVEGGRTSHAAIIARSLAVPAVVGVGESLESIGDGETVLVDGEAGEVVVDPDEARRDAVREFGPDAILERVETADGRPVEVAANVGGEAELAPAAERGADGVGLFRTEFLFVDRESPPTEDEQYEAVTAALSAFPDDRVVVRTLDVGGDKPIPYLDLSDEENPFLGRRGVRLSLDEHAALFETQLRALLRAAATEDGDGLAVMFPLVTRVEEVERAVDAVESVAADLASEGVAHAVPELGAMVETPAAAFLADALADRLDFLSVGTNDLAQYVMAADRGNDAVADYHDPLHPAVLRALDRTTAAAEGSDIWVGMCGEMAGDPALTELLVGLGFDELSMSAVTVPEVKARVREVDADAAASLANEALACETRGEVLDVLGIDDRDA
ncbi:phosphoenolpyruvate--protein phosphotransferase [Halorubrum sp. Atlit-8R]|uniref:phosphoenolpyruvate--protein phosphotransferase n=1 Tax=unclassified Halorubrum TaxID=2642239 RepID=UPI000EF1911C|nr:MULTISPECIES: phosphoenolpyruvate--protein phosphotransferase [unclassified Halorubrum]RLM63463.1 phosphoenolpyruvate--protein phosphotransferase [Halorubrum sp. Atlit-9R]RLM76939.1 phosphoenolpyruvate--protein phosphotransferase [Halorubrum sp. Atlit-8R]